MIFQNIYSILKISLMEENALSNLQMLKGMKVIDGEDKTKSYFAKNNCGDWDQ